jgi:hypothetical protein
MPRTGTTIEGFMFRLIVPTALVLSFTGAAMAQTAASDLAYCENLYATYDRYIAPRGESRSTSGVEAIAAVEQCRRGNTAAGIPVLEKKLRDGRFTLPGR